MSLTILDYSLNTTTDYNLWESDYESLFVNLSNWTSIAVKEPKGKELWREIPLGIVLTFLCLLTTVGNAMVLHAVRTERRLQSVSNMFIVSLAIADLIVGLIVMPISTVYIFTKDWLFGVAVCQIWIGIDYTASTASILNLFILSLDRYWSVTSPLKYLSKRTKKRAVLMITGVWCLSSMWIIPIAGWHHFFHRGSRTVPENVCDTEYAKNSGFKVITAFFNFYLPLAVMYGLYWKIFQEIRKRSELELGQRNIKSCHSQVSALNSGQEETSFSDQKNNSGSHIDNANSNRIPVDIKLYNSSRKHRVKKKKQKTSITNRIFKPKKVRRREHQTNGDANRTLQISKASDKRKIEYVYDENVIDEETEKVERYFYEDYSSLKAPKLNSLLIRNSGNFPEELSSPSTPVSSASSTEDRRMKANQYSLVNGLRKIREAETIIDSTTVEKNKVDSHKGTRFVFRDERGRRPSCATNVSNIRNRIKTIRQSSALTKEIKAARQLGVIMGAFTLCFLPYFILFLVVAFCDGCVEQGLILAMTWVGYLNSTLNPFLYPLCNANFRRKFRMMLGIRGKRARYRHRDRFERNSLTTAARYD